MHTGDHLIITPAMGSKVNVTLVAFKCIFKQNGAQEWIVNWINKTNISGILKAASNGLRQ